MTGAPLSPEREAERERRIETAYAHALLTAAIAGMGCDWRSGRRFFRSEDRVAEAIPVVLSALDHARSETAADRWRCFHCDEVFTERSCALEHFGPTDDSLPACRIKAGAEGSLVRALREAEKAAADAWHAVQNETSDVHQAMYAAAGRHQASLQGAEEAGYEKGIADLRAETASAHERGRALEEGLRAAIRVADEAREEWDKAPSGMRAGKILIALSGHCPRYRADIDAILSLIPSEAGS